MYKYTYTDMYFFFFFLLFKLFYQISPTPLNFKHFIKLSSKNFKKQYLANLNFSLFTILNSFFCNYQFKKLLSAFHSKLFTNVKDKSQD